MLHGVLTPKKSTASHQRFCAAGWLLVLQMEGLLTVSSVLSPHGLLLGLHVQTREVPFFFCPLSLPEIPTDSIHSLP